MDNTITKIEAIIAEAEAMRNAYFFLPPGNAGGRRSYEKRHSHEEVTWSESGHAYTAEYVVCCTCRNVYAEGYYTKDGKKTTLTAIKNSLKRMKGE